MTITQTGTFAHRLRQVMTDCDIAPQELADTALMTERRIKWLLEGRREPKRTEIQNLAKILDVDMYWLEHGIESSTICDNCEDGYAGGCPHADGRHYNSWGEGIAPPDWCPQHTDELPF